ncbi:hypothetical protein CCH79_00015861 [Gambusia affinis]|uniref:Uncharacterized protein n=1 Tax=Gambusia affinis TaxID=33528 RepID=A0A315VA63_GAMAF|nr:hypothetical protein CCH79_00015861 [Gambusia affinis]
MEDVVRRSVGSLHLIRSSASLLFSPDKDGYPKLCHCGSPEFIKQSSSRIHEGDSCAPSSSRHSKDIHNSRGYKELSSTSLLVFPKTSAEFGLLGSQVGIDQGDIPDLSQGSFSAWEGLEFDLSLENYGNVNWNQLTSYSSGRCLFNNRATFLAGSHHLASQRPLSTLCICVQVHIAASNILVDGEADMTLQLDEAPSSLLEALEQHLASLEGKKTKELNADTRASTLSSAVSSLSSTGMSFSRMDEKEKQQALEEEQARLQALKDQRLKEISMQTPPSASPSSQSIGSANNNNHISHTPEMFGSVLNANSVPNLNSDLFDLQPAFIPAGQSTPSISNANSAWGGLESRPLQQTTQAMSVDFDAVFGNKATPSNNGPQPAAGFDALGDLLKPTVTAHTAPPPPPPPQMAIHPGGKLLANDLDSSLANLVGNLQFGGTGAKKPEMQWSQSGEKKLTGGQNWQNKTMSTTQWSSAPMAPQPMPVPHVAPAPMAFPMTTPQVPVYGMVPPQMAQMGGVPVMAPQPMMYNQPVLRPTNPFAPMPGAQGEAECQKRQTKQQKKTTTKTHERTIERREGRIDQANEETQTS